MSAALRIAQSYTPNATCCYPGCHKGAWQNPDGSYSSFCSKKHRDTMQQSNGPSPSVGGAKLCKNCHLRPVYVDANRMHEFCGNRCHDAFQGGIRGAQGIVRAGICKLPGCQKPVYVGPNGKPSDYCSRSHHAQGVELCLLCRQRPKVIINGKMSDFCSNRCKDDTFGSTPVILNISPDMASFQDVSKQFTDQWKHSTTKPAIVKIWKVYCHKSHTDAFMSYKRHVERNTHITGGNSRRRWHGTTRTCTIGDSENKGALCKDAKCSICRIIEFSFHKGNVGVFGPGIYTSATSSNSNAYVKNLGGSPYKAMLLNDVVLGKTIKMTNSSTSLTEPPHGYNSVIGEPASGRLDYDEAVVYRNDAIRPLFLIIYNG